MMKQVLLVTMVCLAAAVLAAETSAQQARGGPNVVLIMADDLGYQDLGCYGNDRFATPRLDGIAANGIRLTEFYSGASVCTPSRMALMTGCYPARLGWERGVVGYLMPPGSGLHPEAVTMAEVMKQAGYVTGMSGKWHMGNLSPLRPEDQGFDSFYGIMRSNNQTDALWRDRKVIERPYDKARLTELFTEEAKRFIREHKEKPFFLYLPHTAPHFPVIPHPDWKGKTKYGAYGDVVQELDARVGEVLDLLDELQLTKKTLVIFTSDNGPRNRKNEGFATPLSGRKWDALEGGNRVSCVMQWPGTLPAGKTVKGMVSAMDLLPTIAGLIGATVPRYEGFAIDGLDVWPLLSGKKEKSPRTELLYWHGKDGVAALRKGEWKAFVGGKAGEPGLFNLETDVAESANQGAALPERLLELQMTARKAFDEVAENGLPLGKESATGE